MVCFISFISDDVNVTSWLNPLVSMNIEWTDEMVSDFRKYEEDVKAVYPSCRLYNLKTVAVSCIK